MPFSDPLADGPDDPALHLRGAAQGMTLPRTLELIARGAAHEPGRALQLPEPDAALRHRASAARCGRASASPALLLTDLPAGQRSGASSATVRQSPLDLIRLVAPTHAARRGIADGGRRGEGFLYLVSRLGVTGASRDLADRSRRYDRARAAPPRCRSRSGSASRRRSRPRPSARSPMAWSWAARWWTCSRPRGCPAPRVSSLVCGRRSEPERLRRVMPHQPAVLDPVRLSLQSAGAAGDGRGAVLDRVAGWPSPGCTLLLFIGIVLLRAHAGPTLQVLLPDPDAVPLLAGTVTVGAAPALPALFAATWRRRRPLASQAVRVGERQRRRARRSPSSPAFGAYAAALRLTGGRPPVSRQLPSLLAFAARVSLFARGCSSTSRCSCATSWSPRAVADSPLGSAQRRALRRRRPAGGRRAARAHAGGLDRRGARARRAVGAHAADPRGCDCGRGSSEDLRAWSRPWRRVRASTKRSPPWSAWRTACSTGAICASGATTPSRRPAGASLGASGGPAASGPRRTSGRCAGMRMPPAARRRRAMRGAMPALPVLDTDVRSIVVLPIRYADQTARHVGGGSLEGASL